MSETRSPASYPLLLEPDGRSWTARENLTDLIRRELLGPLGGPDELLPTSPDTAYLVGRIAPAKLAGDGDPQDAEEDGAPAEVGNGWDATQSRGVPQAADDDASPDGDEDTVDDSPPQRGLMIPASMGLRFQIPLDLDSFTVHSSWGTYRSQKTGELTSTGREVRAYRRTPVEVASTVRVADLTPGQTLSVALVDEVVLRIDSHRDTTRHRLLVEIALCNDKVVPRRIPAGAWLFQTQLAVAAGGAAAFLPVVDLLEEADTETDDELRRLNLQYRNRLEFAIGRTCSADWTVTPGARRATEVRTTWLPSVETPQVRAREIEDAVLDMTRLADPAVDLDTALRPIVTAYADWLDAREAEAATLPGHLAAEGEDAVHEARTVLNQLATGLDHLLGDAEAQRCFRFMNAVMAEQRLQTQVAERRTKDARLGRQAARAGVLAAGARAHSWRTFQLAFVLMQLPALTRPELTQRSDDELAKVELLFFPTGGGKTEAYLGLAAYAFAIRRRQGVLPSADGPLDGRSGVTVLMRYTLRLLTSQQFQRATALVCAAELARQAAPEVWGDEPFRIGLWVGTDVSPKRYEEAAEQIVNANDHRSHRLTVLQVQRCPWCGAAITAEHVRAEAAERRVYVYCGDDLAECPFSRGGSVGDGLPMLTVDEEIYRLAPTFVIATVDKFARLAREGEAASLFGYVRQRCDRHGFVHEDYRHCDLQPGGKHPRRNGLPAAAVRPALRLRPPDLIIQDELHLITGALGTTVGLFEVAIHVLCAWRTSGGDPVQPLIVASTATVRNAHDQVRGLYGRGVTVFPPQVLDVADSFFAAEVPVTEATPGRRYLGISTTGVRLTAAEIRVAEVAMTGAQLLLDRDQVSGRSADPYLTLVGYFNAIRELAGMARYLADDVQTVLAKGRRWSALPTRFGTEFGQLHTAELTSRISSRDITRTLDQMAVGFDPARDSAAGRREQARLRAAGQAAPRAVDPYDVVLATAMLQVGVDVTRLGLMLMVGQPKNTAEYIQATSRVGRDPERPGLVLTLGNWARPRDLAHFEQFRHYHETFYAQVEALSVTPFSLTSIERGAAAVLVSAARVSDALRPDGLSPEKGARLIDASTALVDRLVTALVARARRAAGDDVAGDRASRYLQNRRDTWSKRRATALAQSKNLVYERVLDPAQQAALLIAAENADASGAASAPPFVVANSMREVQGEINLLVSPLPERLFDPPRPSDPPWRAPEETDR